MMMGFIGGVLIGVAALLLLFFNGRIMGVAGIVRSSLSPAGPAWRWAFIAAVIGTGFALRAANPELVGEPLFGIGQLAIAGLIVGYGTSLGSGCTSGHGVCGIGRLSKRGIVATLTFMATAMITVFLMHLGRV